MPVELPVGKSLRIRHEDESTYQQHRVVRQDDNSYTFARWCTPAKGAIQFVTIPLEPADLLQITDGPEGTEVVYVVSTGGGVLDRTPYTLDRLPESIRQNALKLHLDKFREFEAVLQSTPL